MAEAAAQPSWLPYAAVVAGTAALTALMRVPELGMDPVNAALIYLFPILIGAVYGGRGPAVAAAGAGILAFDFFFVPPVLSFTVADLRYLVSFAVYLAVALLTSELAGRLKRQVRQAVTQQRQTAILYDISRSMSDVADVESLVRTFRAGIGSLTGEETVFYLPGKDGRLVRYGADPAAAPDVEEERMRRIVESVARQEAGDAGSIRILDGATLLLPLTAEEESLGVLLLRGDPQQAGAWPADRTRCEAMAGLAAGALARIRRGEEARLAQVTAESERLRAALLDSVSHELRTPLAEMIGSSSALLESGALFGEEERRELLVSIRGGALRMNRLVANLLGMVRLESGLLRLRRDWVGTDELVGAALRQLKEARGERAVELRLGDPAPLLRGDPVLLEQMLVNLIGNAVKYSPDGSRIVIAAEEREGFVRIAVRDEGIGIPEADRERIFQKFYRSGNAASVTGTGLGLSIAKAVAELHGGSIAAGPGDGGIGAVMTVELPAAATDQTGGGEHDE
ncbi:Osmosensitive K+ channel histidine kinase KdpD [Paenibacillus pasadenensis]|uniref:histidine kinase n=1 Tax=Paenibacillus pasadenensis TaxID=217090 RepID=A0A2N5N582_9BACL|nr:MULTISPECIES: ATP-binding protein [Paenibacillus]PLT45472.1 Osmosensitive K+ channel histidine kinase KdpD [Paenibacillus pasadenensis]QGG55950.1 DUF4118 domain-containing protein [Paenibacillus sp. B01]